MRTGESDSDIPEWICLNPGCSRYMKKTFITYRNDEDGRPVFYCASCGGLEFEALEVLEKDRKTTDNSEQSRHSLIESLDYQDLYWGARLSEAEILEKKLEMITEKINEIIDSINQGV